MPVAPSASIQNGHFVHSFVHSVSYQWQYQLGSGFDGLSSGLADNHPSAAADSGPRHRRSADSNEDEDELPRPRHTRRGHRRWPYPIPFLLRSAGGRVRIYADAGGQAPSWRCGHTFAPITTQRTLREWGWRRLSLGVIGTDAGSRAWESYVPADSLAFSALTPGQKRRRGSEAEEDGTTCAPTHAESASITASPPSVDNTCGWKIHDGEKCGREGTALEVWSHIRADHYAVDPAKAEPAPVVVAIFIADGFDQRRSYKSTFKTICEHTSSRYVNTFMGKPPVGSDADYPKALLEEQILREGLDVTLPCVGIDPRLTSKSYCASLASTSQTTLDDDVNLAVNRKRKRAGDVEPASQAKAKRHGQA
ncbi:uncharacterized protein B0H18DRAFT_1209881 [Fomitopsis serialis]|uniref:uncharacterized protein n=1 Tax=Fomitopsis serialis TaxID=139415 RepID=UPI0020087A3C|nr:uncharacterized protein B0H18DRAFT_1209881 [Neoantrodia serialis]KAH9929455.1 hypothetical protein B0H18DRAFT_1209881 [Neoantrodia serialis]